MTVDITVCGPYEAVERTMTTTSALPSALEVLDRTYPALYLLLHLDDPRVRRDVRHAGGYTATYESYGVGSPGHHVQVGRDSDCQRLYGGPNVDQPYWHPDWSAMTAADRRGIRAALDAAPDCEGCATCDRYREIERLGAERALAENRANAARVLPRLLAELAELDARLDHSPDADWPPHDRDRRNRLAWWVATHAHTLGLPVGFEWVGGDGPADSIVYVELPDQVSWHVSTQDRPSWTVPPRLVEGAVTWDGHTREQTAERIAAYLASLAAVPEEVDVTSRGQVG